MQVFMDQRSTFVTARIRMPWIQQPSVCLWMLCAASKSTECFGLARHVALSLSYAGINQLDLKPIVTLDTRLTNYFLMILKVHLLIDCLIDDLRCGTVYFEFLRGLIGCCHDCAKATSREAL